MIGYGFDSPGADFMGKDLQLEADGVTFALEAEGERHEVRLAVPGRHNASNALAAIAAARALGVRLEDAVHALGRFEGLKRRLETVGEAAGVTVIDDFAHNPDKIAATLATLRAQPGRLLIMFQPHGYGPLTKMGEELAESLAEGNGAPTTGCTCPTRSIRAARSSGRAAPTGSPSEVSERGGRPSTSPSARRSAMRCWPKPSPATAS